MPYRTPIVPPGPSLEKVLKAACIVCDAANANRQVMREEDVPTVGAIIDLEVSLIAYGCYRDPIDGITKGDESRCSLCGYTARDAADWPRSNTMVDQPKPDIKPTIDKDGVGWCLMRLCPHYHSIRPSKVCSSWIPASCDLQEFQSGPICLPWAREAAKDHAAMERFTQSDAGMIEVETGDEGKKMFYYTPDSWDAHCPSFTGPTSADAILAAVKKENNE